MVQVVVDIVEVANPSFTINVLLMLNILRSGEGAVQLDVSEIISIGAFWGWRRYRTRFVCPVRVCRFCPSILCPTEVFRMNRCG